LHSWREHEIFLKPEEAAGGRVPWCEEKAVESQLNSYKFEQQGDYWVHPEIQRDSDTFKQMKSRIVKARLLKQQQQPDESVPGEGSSGVHTRTKRLRDDDSERL
jgi:hypothetical protein